MPPPPPRQVLTAGTSYPFPPPQGPYPGTMYQPLSATTVMQAGPDGTMQPGTSPQPSASPFLPGASAQQPANQEYLDRQGYSSDASGNQYSPVYFVPEYLLWKTTGQHLPVLATTSPAGTPFAESGVPGAPGTSVLYGNQTILDQYRSGTDWRHGFWFDEAHTSGIDAGLFYLGNRVETYYIVSNPNFLVSRPFTDAATGTPMAVPVLYNNPADTSNVFLGHFTTQSNTNLWGADFNIRRNLYSDENLRMDVTAGYQFMRLHDTVEIGESLSNVSGGGYTPGTAIGSLDQFFSTSRFNGLLLASLNEWNYDRLFMQANVKIAIGTNRNDVNIQGHTFIDQVDQFRINREGGVLTGPSNIGQHTENEFSVIPQGSLMFGYQITQQVRIFAGYSFMYWTNVVRAADHINTTVNSSNLPIALSQPTGTGPAQPAFTFHDSDFWAHGVTIGLDFRW